MFNCYHKTRTQSAMVSVTHAPSSRPFQQGSWKVSPEMFLQTSLGRRFHQSLAAYMSRTSCVTRASPRHFVEGGARAASSGSVAPTAVEKEGEYERGERGGGWGTETKSKRSIHDTCDLVCCYGQHESRNRLILLVSQVNFKCEMLFGSEKILIFQSRRMYLRRSARVAQFLLNQACQYSPFWLTGCTLQRRPMIGCLFQPHCATSQLHSRKMHF